MLTPNHTSIKKHVLEKNFRRFKLPTVEQTCTQAENDGGGSPSFGGISLYPFGMVLSGRGRKTRSTEMSDHRWA